MRGAALAVLRAGDVRDAAILRHRAQGPRGAARGGAGEFGGGGDQAAAGGGAVLGAAADGLSRVPVVAAGGQGAARARAWAGARRGGAVSDGAHDRLGAAHGSDGDAGGRLHGDQRGDRAHDLRGAEGEGRGGRRAAGGHAAAVGRQAAARPADPCAPAQTDRSFGTGAGRGRTRRGGAGDRPVGREPAPPRVPRGGGDGAAEGEPGGGGAGARGLAGDRGGGRTAAGPDVRLGDSVDRGGVEGGGPGAGARARLLRVSGLARA